MSTSPATHLLFWSGVALAVIAQIVSYASTNQDQRTRVRKFALVAGLVAVAFSAAAVEFAVEDSSKTQIICWAALRSALQQRWGTRDSGEWRVICLNEMTTDQLPTGRTMARTAFRLVVFSEAWAATRTVWRRYRALGKGDPWADRPAMEVPMPDQSLHRLRGLGIASEAAER